jgi:DNA polymerase
MGSEWRPLLEALIGELEYRRALGLRFVALSAQGLAVLEGLTHPTVLGSAGGRGGKVSARAVSSSGPAAKPPASEALGAQSGGKLKGSNVVPTGQVTGGVGVLPGLFGEARRSGLDREARLAAFEELRRRVLQCTRCPHLVASRKNVVFGVGTPEAELVFVGEAPGMEEDEQGEPFVGPAGQLLTKIIQAMGFSRDQVYIANILKCRPDTPGQTSGNRKPTPTEMATCFPYLREQLQLIQPKVIVALGATAVEGLLGKVGVGITRLRGQWQEWEGIPVMPTYHPAYLLRNQSPAEKRKVWEDMLKVLERLGRPITERQRNYFTRGGGDRP